MSEQTTKKYFCVAKKWWDKVNGNTYFNAKIMDDNGETLFYTGFQYGYGSHYLSVARKMLEKLTTSEFTLIDLGDTYTLKRVLKHNEF